MRAALLGYEAFVTRLMAGDTEKLGDFKARHQAEKDFKDRSSHQRESAEWRSYELLRNIRGAIAHGTERRDPRQQSAFSSAEKMRASLESCFRTLIPAR